MKTIGQKLSALSGRDVQVVELVDGGLCVVLRLQSVRASNTPALLRARAEAISRAAAEVAAAANELCRAQSLDVNRRALNKRVEAVTA